jgi:sugar phosphate isomerase/epimerase
VVDSPGDHPTPQETVARLQKIMPRFSEAGVKLAIENHDRFSSADLAHIVQQLGPADCGICLDTVNSFGALEGPELVVKNLAPYTLNLHVKDFTIQRVPSQMGFVITGSVAGRGRLNVPWLTQSLRNAGVNPNAILELWTPLAADLEETIRVESTWAEESIRYLRTLIPN